MKPMLAFALLLTACATGADAQTSDAEIRAAVVSAADYAADVLIQKDGRGRIEYDLTAASWNDYEVHWHTAQTLFGLVKAYETTGDKRYLETARRAGDWWVSTEYKDPHPFAGLVAAAHGDRLGPLINMTTITDGTNALFALSRATGDPKYADTATRSGEWLLENAYIPEEGLFYNIFDPSDGTVWTDKSPHHPEIGPDAIAVTQVARPNSEGYLFADMCRHTGEQRYCDVFLAVANAKIARQYSNGLWMDFEPNDPGSGTVHPRFNLWLAEAQIEAFEMTGKQKYLDSALATARAFAGYQQKDGAIFYRLKADGSTASRFEPTGSAVAFAGILWLRLAELAKTDEFDGNIERSMAWLLANQFADDHPDPNLAGAILNVRIKQREGRTVILQRDIGTSFALRFWADYLAARSGTGG
ncbi:MAG: glycoside hydrolase family 88 protein [Erythrobacter sp.]|jgi:rhamnogalacturonyl hydrolase YesR|nr:glycoside hydrolase family 88 protein [Erythrobacter sp.]